MYVCCVLFNKYSILDVQEQKPKPVPLFSSLFREFLYLCVVIILQYSLQCFKLPVFHNSVLSVQTDVKEPHLLVNLLSWFSDAI